jgi:transposase
VSQTEFSENLESTKFETYSKEKFIDEITLLQSELAAAIKEIYRLKNQELTDSQLKLMMQEQLGELRGDKFGGSSERYKKPAPKPKEPKSPEPRVRKPSERYPNVPVRNVVISMDPVPNCNACGSLMNDSGMFEESEQLTVIPKKFEIICQKRTKYRCGCQGCIVTTQNPVRIVPGSTYSDEMILDVVLSKYCDLIPIERYATMAQRSGVMDLPPQSLIELTHSFADFASSIYLGIKSEVQNARVVHGDESPQNMLEGSSTKSWYLWGFSTKTSCYLECHNTRSGDVASDFLKNAVCKYLITDDYGGYSKAQRIVNQHRLGSQLCEMLINALCNAHARRYFFKSRVNYDESFFYLDAYHEIYQLEGEAKKKPPDEVLVIRSKMKSLFESMKSQAEIDKDKYSSKGQLAKACNYFLDNYDGLTQFLTDADVPIDNNAQERMLRSHVVGRKTWYGVHSERGAWTAAVLFSIIETCKLNKVNPKEYLESVTEDLLHKRQPPTPSKFKSAINA